MIDEQVFTDRLGEKHSKPENEILYERFAVYGIVLRDNQILLVKSVRFDEWEIPGGGIEMGESDEEALKREFEEETGYFDIEVLKHFSTEIRHFYHRVKERFYQSEVKYYLVAIDTKKYNPDLILRHECSETAWFDLDRIPENLNLHNRKILSVLRKG